MSTSQKEIPESNPKQESGSANTPGEAMERTSIRIGLALASAAVGGAAKAIFEHFLKEDQ